jgi:hypothetical protein
MLDHRIHNDALETKDYVLCRKFHTETSRIECGHFLILSPFMSAMVRSASM